ncbi:Poly-beta-1,6-N-acetyl-D-glucosamine N-deacetylase precursor [compost metagenome]
MKRTGRSFKVRMLLGGFIILLLFISSYRGSTVDSAALFEDEVAVLSYHHIDDQMHNLITVTGQQFKDQLLFLRDQGYNFISLKDFKRYLAGGEIPDNAVLITFDDGYQSFYKAAYPMLTELNIPAVSFVITDTMDQVVNSKVPYLSSSEIKEMAAAPERLLEFQCHSDGVHKKDGNRPYLTSRLSSESETDYENRITSDTNTCKNKLAALQEPVVDTYAFPFGSHDDKSIQLLKQAGIKYAFTVQTGLVDRKTDAMRLPRISAGNPWVKPEDLNRLIKNQIYGFDPPFDSLPLRQLVEQLDGKVWRNKDKTINISIENEHWLISDFQTAQNVNKPELPAIELDKPIETKRRHLYIDLADLQKLVNKHIVYDEETRRFHLEGVSNKSE